MRLIHTSDWHIGRTLYGRKRYHEFEKFLDWLVGQIAQQSIDALLVAGDIFDNSTPSNKAQKMYYQFLCRVANSGCRHVVITAGNHDSPSLLNAPKDVLQFLNVHVIGGVTDCLEDEVLLLKDKSGEPEMIVCAVPYLRDRDIRWAEAGESLEDKGQKLIAGIRDHYRDVCEIAERQRSELPNPVPIVAMGHLFTAGGKTTDGDGVRDLYVGSLAYVESAIFSESIDYLALGHLHMAQKVGGSETRRYCGAPLPMSFGEASQQKSVSVVDFSTEPQISAMEVPCFQKLVTVCGDLETILSRIEQLKGGGKKWLEVVYDGDAVLGSELQESLNEAVVGSDIEILRTRNNRVIERVLNQEDCAETLDDLEVDDVFKRCLVSHEVPDEQARELIATFQEIVVMLHEEDGQVE